VCIDVEVLDDEITIALDGGAFVKILDRQRRNLVDRQLPSFGPFVRARAFAFPLFLLSLIRIRQPAGLDFRSSRGSLEPVELVAQRLDLLVLAADDFHKRQHQRCLFLPRDLERANFEGSFRTHALQMSRKPDPG